MPRRDALGRLAGPLGLGSAALRLVKVLASYGRRALETQLVLDEMAGKVLDEMDVSV